ncbi:MAG: hypothetical protein JWQ72_2750 [Polaromonas sp.]|nr:hypothetical protein [Polaromonas sp.]
MAVYKKTHKGMEEVLAERPRIDTRLFNVLVLVDGVRDSTEIKRLAQEASLPSDALDILVHGGYLEQKFKGTPSPARQPPPPAEAPPRMSKQADASIRFRGFQDLYAYLVEQTKALLGLRGFTFQLRIERANSVEALEALIAPLSEAIAKKHGFEVTQNFRRESALRVRVAIAERQYLDAQAGRPE